MEIYFQNKNKNLFKKTSYFKFKEIADKQKLMPMIRPTHLKDIHTNKIVPVSVVSNTKTLLCMDNDKPIYFESDNLGFDNKNNKNVVDIVLLGDSYGAGYCVGKAHRFNSLFKKKGFDIVNFSMGGNGPLLELASLVEYGKLFNFDIVVLLFTPENDYENFEREIQNPILKQYLNYGFKQNLIEKNDEKDQLYYDYYKKKNKPFKQFLKQYHLDLKILRKKIKNIKFKKTSENKFTNYKSETVSLVNSVFKNFKNYADSNGKKLLIVYNALHPEILFNKIDEKLKKDIQESKIFLKKENIYFFDYNSYLSDNYNRSNIEKIMKKRDNNYWDHYTEEGYRLLTEQILIEIKKIKNN